MAKPYSRPLSYISERQYLIMDRLCTPFVNQPILEGTGVLDRNRWRAAVEKASAANPGTRLVLKGIPGFRRWVDSGICPPVREVDGSKWNGFDQNGAPFLQTQLPYRQGPTCEVLLIQGDPPRIAFRTLHAAIDGRGTMIWMEDIFNALRGDPLIGSTSSLPDYKVMRSFQEKTILPVPSECPGPTGSPDGNEPGFEWRRKDLPGRFSKLLPRVALLVADEVRRHSKEKVRLSVAVDLRPRVNNIRSTANLVGFIFIEILPGHTVLMIAEDISHQLSERREGMRLKYDVLNKFFPLWYMRNMMLKTVNFQYTSNRFFHTGLISNIGKMPMEKYTGGGFHATNGFWIPPPNKFLPVFVVLSGTTKGVSLTATMPGVFSTQGRIDKFMDNLEAGILSGGV